MGLTMRSCPRCWDSPEYCKCTPAEMSAYEADVRRRRAAFAAEYESRKPLTPKSGVFRGGLGGK